MKKYLSQMVEGGELTGKYELVKKAPPSKARKEDSDQEDSWEEEDRVTYATRKYTFSLLNPANVKLKQYAKLHTGNVMGQRSQVVPPSDGQRPGLSR